MTSRSFRLQALAVLAAVLSCPVWARAEKSYDPGASDTEIRIGNTSPYSGPASAYGNIGRTIEAVFRMANDAGGVNGRRLTFLTYDDAYAPPRALEMTRRLVEEDNVLVVFQTLGTAPNSAIHRYLNTKQVPQLFVASGATKWGQPKAFPWTIGLQPSYATEAAVYARHILANVPEPRIGILMQNDDYGRDYLAGFMAGLGEANQRLVVLRATYETTDPTVDSQIIALKGSGANVFFNITTPKFAAQAIRKAAEIGWRPAHYLNGVSASFATVFKPAGLDASQGIILALYRKDVTDPQWHDAPDVQAWRAFMARYMPGADPADDGHNYGYMAAHVLLEVLRKSGDDLTRANIMRQAASLKQFAAPLLLPGVTLTTGRDDFFPIESVRLGRVKGQSFELFGDVISVENR
jgi:branched-chain amino acid transport system substrate-binding protein